MPVDVVREKPESLNSRAQGVILLQSGHHDQDPIKDPPLDPHFIVSVARGPEVSTVRSLTELCGLQVRLESSGVKGPTAVQPLPGFGHTQSNCA
jgi:hypothetical protein